MPTLLAATPPPPLEHPGTVDGVADELRALRRRRELDLPLPGGGATTGRWAALAGWGRRDLALARLAEGHADATAILAEADRTPVPGALYGVWASRAGGGARLHGSGAGLVLCGTAQFCSGASTLDRALVAGDDDRGDQLLVEVALHDRRVHQRGGTWQAIGMAASDSPDVTFTDLPLHSGAVVGPPGFYTGRPGFALGGAGVAAVWLGGAAGVLDATLAVLRGADPDPHRLAHVAALHTALATTDALLARTAATIDADPGGSHALLVDLCRSAAERTARETFDRAPAVLGPGPLCRNRALAQRLADLGVYVRQHHGERDLARLGARLLATEIEPGT